MRPKGARYKMQYYGGSTSIGIRRQSLSRLNLHNIVASTCIAHRVSCIVIFLAFLSFLILTLALTSQTYAAPQMADYCYLPPFVTDPNTPPNVMIVYEKGSAIAKRAYSPTYTYDAQNPYYGFFDSSAKYKFTVDNETNKNFCPNYFYKDNACNPATNKRCISGNILNWALMTSLDLSRKVLVGFGWPKAVTSQGAGDVYTYSGNFCSAWSGTTCTNQNLTPVSYGQYEDGNADTSVTVSVDTDGNGTNDYTYRFCMSKGAPESFVTVNGQAGTSAPSCPNPNTPAKCKTSGTCLGSGLVAMKFTDEDRKGIIQEYADKDSNYVYDSDAPRFGLRRWKTSTAADERDRDILCDASGGNCASTTKTTLLKELLNAFSKEPAIDPDATPSAALGTMMKDIIKYSKGNTSTYEDKEVAGYTQTPYSWSTDPAYKCRKTFAIFVTTGADLTESGTALDLTEVSPACDSLTYTDCFVKDTCYGFNKDLYDDPDDPEKKQNIRTYVVHTTFYGSGSGNVSKLEYASKTVGGGEYISVDNPAKLRSKLEEALLNILSTSASASTVATLTTQTRESSTLTQAYFYPKREGTPLRWIGYLRLLWSDSGANLREDTMNRGWLDLKKDDILSFYYDPVSVSYKARTYADSDGDLKMDNCAPSTMLNDDVLTIWNAQTKLQNATPDETKTPSDTPSGRLIKIGIGNPSGIVSGSTCVSNSGFCNLTTSLNATLQPYWNYASYCSDYTARWCAQTSDCNYCTALRAASVDRGCSSASDCYYCDGRKTRKCSTTLTCIDTTTGLDLGVACATVGTSCGGTGICVGDCYEYNGTCSSGTCSLNTSISCSVDTDCINDYHGSVGGSGCVSDTCTTAAAGTCVQECDSACATSIIKFARGYDKPTGSSFRIRHQCDDASADTSCPIGKTCCPSGQTCNTTTGLCSGSDVRMTLKLGDIVYSTPRISPNSAVFGYDVMYKDTTYGNWVNLQMKGNCTNNTDCPGSETCSDGVCTNDGYTSIVIVGANDGMVHAFKVSKIKDISPAENDCGGDASCNGVSDGYQTARFADKPRDSSDTAPPSDVGKELWAYIPFNAVPYLRWYCSESYCHIPMVDARFAVIDASIDYDKDGTVESSEDRIATDVRCTDSETGCDCLPEVGGKCTYPWRRLLIGAMGVGGKKITVGNNTWSSSVFVLDITDPTSPKLLWEKPLPDNTLTTSTPAVVRLSSKLAGGSAKNDDENGRWYLVFGSGPESVTTNKLNYKTGNANIYVFDLRTGNVEATLSTGASGVAVGDMMAVDFDSDYQVDDIYFGTYGGAGTALNPFKGKLYRLRIRNGASYNTPSNWTISTVVTPGGGNGRPIYASPEIAVDTLGNKWLYAGTGLYLTFEHAKPRCKDDESITCNSDSDCPTGTCGVDEYIGGFKETEACWKGSGSCSEYTNFLNTTEVSFTGAKAVEVGCFCAGSLVKTIICDADGNCPPVGSDESCGDAKICINNTSQTCSADDDCPTTGLCVASKCINTDSQACSKDSECPSTPRCVENKVVLKVTDASCSGSCSPNVCGGCTGPPLKDKAAIDWLSNLITSSYDGWYRTIPKQKSFSKPFVAGGLVDFTTFQPKSTVCSLGGDTYLWALHYTTGTAYVQPTISMAGGTSGSTTGGLTIKASVNLGTGVPPLGESLVALPLSGDTYKVITQVSGGLPGTTMAPSLPAKSGYVLWLVK